MMQSIFNRFAALIISTLMLTACGGGGGGGGGGGDDGSSGGGNSYSQQFNPYMPFTEDTAINYADGTSGLVAYDAALSTNSRDVYSVTYGEDDGALTLLFESTPNAIKLHGIRGNFDVSIVTITQLLFQTPLVISDDSNASYAPTIATAKVKYGIATINVNVDVSYTKAESDAIFTAYGDGNLPVIQSVLNTTIDFDGSVAGNAIVIHETLQTTLQLAKGIGIVSHEGDYAGLEFDAQISSLTDLPEPIWFEYNAGEPINVTPDTTFQITSQMSPVNAQVYKVANLNELNALGWFTLEEDSASNTFNVSLQNDPELPDTLTSVEVVFEHRSSGERMSGNVTLLP
ncbi:hypothetical protein [Ketobacter sp.]|uniref:hypothetical protein n=1 Tax=Ketobacter sp. TaxID=2083498 RepID=UPI000F10A7CD|nr:hypothetical protein [Ketobacter sp.]RLT95113.1 MAG: hypothetical protein D9N14_15550 [Ketobacter sp.]